MIRLKDVELVYDNGTKAIQGITLTIEDGEFVLLTGESGTGKSTLIRLLLKETEPDGGEIYVEGKPLSQIARGDIPIYRRGIGTVFQDFKLFEEYTVFGNLELVMKLTGGGGKGSELKVTHILKLLGIDRLHKRYPKELSGGEKQKVCMARALINMPKILLADEPTGNLDPESSAEILRLLEVVHRQGITVIMATHDLDTCERVCAKNRMICLDQRS